MLNQKAEQLASGLPTGHRANVAVKPNKLERTLGVSAVIKDASYMHLNDMGHSTPVGATLSRLNPSSFSKTDPSSTPLRSEENRVRLSKPIPRQTRQDGSAP